MASVLPAVLERNSCKKDLADLVLALSNMLLAFDSFLRTERRYPISLCTVIGEKGLAPGQWLWLKRGLP
tara:strand:+ start:1078 stop:1284 length:207 start_codon:yes stop_codon:yes gene_type:complete